jgi:hypothetical protein
MNEREMDSETTGSSCSDRLAQSRTSDPTTGTEGEVDLYLRGTSDSSRLLMELNAQVADPRISMQLMELAWVIDAISRSLPADARSVVDRYAHLAGTIENGSVLLEWVFPDFRIGFNIEPTSEESGWYMVSNKRLHEQTKSGRIGSMREIFGTLMGIIGSHV